MIEDRMHYIDNFFQGLLSPEDVKSFEEKILTDPVFAADLAFYISSRQAARQLAEEEKKDRYKQLLGATNGHQEEKTGKVRKMWYAVGASMAAAVSTAVIVGVFFMNTPSLQEVAKEYVTKNYHELPVKMGNGDDLQNAVDLYNHEQYAQAVNHFENILKKDSSFTVLKYAALSALNAHDYNKALQYFRQMEQDRSQLSNPAALLEALTYMERNQPGDKEQAKLLLEKVRENNLEGKEKAREWIKRLEK